MRAIVALLLALGMSFNGLATSACTDAATRATPGKMSDAMSNAVAHMDHGADHDSVDMPCDCCGEGQPGMDCPLPCLSSPALAARYVLVSTPPLTAAPRTLSALERPDAHDPSPPRRPPRPVA